MSETDGRNKYDLEDRTEAFAKRVRKLAKTLPHTLAHIEDLKQLVKSSGSVGANYIEANEAFSKKDFIFRIKICRKESKESRYWLRMLETSGNSSAAQEVLALIQESAELMKIFGSIIRKSEKKQC